MIRNAAAQAAWQADGGPVPELPAYWSTLWRATVQRQTDLSGRPEPEAAEAVRAMTAHLASLFHDITWFREDEGLRRQAVTEILLLSTDLETDVTSSAAQMAWRRSTADNATPQERAEASGQWRAAWMSWASEHSQP